jgi:F-type H+-transporting ATPase subunit a
VLPIVLASSTDQGGFTPPTIDQTHLPDIIPWMAEYGTGFGKQMLMIILSVILIAAFFMLAMRNARLKPGKVQWLAESGYAFVRNGIGRDIIGEKEFKAWVPLLFGIFFFVLLNNLFGAIPFLQLPSFSHAGSAYALALIVYIIWIGVGVRRNGPRYFKLAVVPSGVPGWILPLLVPLEIISNFIVRPLTHSLRLMATMLSGHMIVMLAGSGAAFLIMETGNLALQGTGVLVILGSVAMYFLELLIMFLQAFVFTLLTAIYIQGALAANEH